MADVSPETPDADDSYHDEAVAKLIGHYTSVVVDPRGDGNTWIGLEERARIAATGARLLMRALRDGDYIDPGRGDIDLIGLEIDLQGLTRRGEQS